MANGAGLDCLEFVTTWVRSGQYLSLDKTPLPLEVRLAEPVAGLHLIHSTSGATVPESTAEALLAQPLGVLARSVEAPPLSVATNLDLDAAITRADALRLPVRVPGNALADSTSDRVLPIDAHGQLAVPATAEYVLVLPATHLVAEHPAAELGHDLSRIVQGPPMPGQVRLAGDRVELGLPLPIVNARFAGIDLTGASADAFRGIEGGIRGLWRDLAANLAVGHATRVRFTQAGLDAPEDLLAVRSPDGVALLRDTPTGAQAATLPRHPATLEVSPAVVPSELHAAAVVREQFAGAVPAVHPDVTAAAVYLGGRGGLMLLDADQTAQIDAARNFRAAVDEYPVFVHGTSAGPIVGGRLVTAEQLRDLIAADPLSRGKTIILVQCDAASSSTVIDDFGATLFAALQREYPGVVAMGGIAWVQRGPARSDELTEVLVTRTVLTPDGEVRLVAGGIRTYTDADSVATATEARAVVVNQYGPALSSTRTGDGVRLTDTSGAVLTGDEAPTIEMVRELTGIGTPADVAAAGVPFNTIAQAYAGVTAARAAAATAALTIAGWADQLRDTGLATAARLFHASNQLQHSDPSTMHAQVFERLRSDDIERIRADLLRRAKVVRDGIRTRISTLNVAVDSARYTRTHITSSVMEHNRLPGLRQYVHPTYVQSFDQLYQFFHLTAKGPYRTPLEAQTLGNLTVHVRGPQGAISTLATILAEIENRLPTESAQLLTSAAGWDGQITTIENGLAWENTWISTSHSLAATIIGRVRAKLSYGPANNDAVIALYNDGATALVRHVRAPVYRKNPNDGFDNWLRYQSATAYMATYFRTGNCDEHAAVVLAELYARPDMVGVPITYVHGNVFDRGGLRVHTFVVIGPLGHPNTLVIDPWPLYPTAVRAAHYIGEMNAVTRAWTVTPDAPRDLYTWGREQIRVELLPRLNHPVLQPVPVPVLAPHAMSYDTLHSNRHAGASSSRRHRFAGTVAPSAVHPAPQDVAVYLPDDRPGLYLLGEDQQHLIDAARTFRAGRNEYPVFIDGTVDGPLVDGQLITKQRMRDLIVADPHSRDRDIVFVVCDLAVTRVGGTPLDDFATGVFTLLPVGNKRVLAAGGVAQVVAGTGNDLTEVVISPNVLGDDGRFRLISGGWREIRDATAVEQVPGQRTPMVVQHGPRLSLTRVETGVALTADNGTLLTGVDAPAVTDLTTLGLPDPARIERLFESGVRQAATTNEQPFVPAEALRPPSWPLRLNHGVTSHGDGLYVISSNSRPAPQQLIDQLVEAADVEHPVILLDAPRLGHATLAADVAALNYLLEQFAQRNQPPVVVTRGRVDSDLLTVLERYGVALLHPTLERADGSGLGGLQADHRWKVTAPRQGGDTETSSDIWEMITPGVLAAAARLASPTEAVARVDDALGELIWAPDLAESREAFHRLEEQWSAERMTAALAQVEKMIERVPDQPELGVFAPVLELGAVGQADIVFDYAGADEARRPKVLLDSVGRLETAGQLNMPVDGGITTQRLGAMVKAVGVTGISVSVLDMLGKIKAGEFEDAADLIKDNRGKLTFEQKQQWVDAINDLRHTSMPHHDAELRLLRDGVLEC
ncbi:hypothetical protein [Micromonospora sp. B9E7]|uniref:hypothetical protein n=1 Tax=Micromonospora sp. B9E7 TaxID=3153574 RepID=UPI00325E5EEA